MAKHVDNFVFRYLMKSGNYAAYSRKEIEKLMRKYGFTVVSSAKEQDFTYTVVGKKV